MSVNFGELIPATCIETVPGDHIELHAADLIRAIPMVTSPFLRAKQHIDVWFVPYRDLWHNFDSFITKKEQPVSSALNDIKYLPWTSLYDIWNNISAASSDYDAVGLPYLDGAKRIVNYLGYGFALQGSSYSDTAGVNPFRLAAYNYIWYNEYRQQYYDTGSRLLPSLTNVAKLFNFDYLDCDTLSHAQIDYTTIEAMCQMRYRTWKKDLYTGLLPSTQFGNVSTINGSIVGSLAVSRTDGSSMPSSSVIQTHNSDTTLSNLYAGTAASQGELKLLNNTSVDVLALRKSEAIQIWRENALRAGNRVSDNMRAHYGVESDFKDHRPTYLGSVSAPLNIGDVMATANSDYSGNTNPNTNVGDIAGKGLSSLDERVFKFDSKDFGVIMVMASVLPEAEYNANGVSRPNQLLEAEDFFVPEYENLGLEPVSSLTFQQTPTAQAKVMGYAPRYWAYKTKLDKCYDLFKTGGMFAPWCSPKYDVTQLLQSGASVVPLATLYVNPQIFDVNFNVGISVSPQFLCDFYFDVDAVRPMSVVGLPFS